MRPRTRSTGLQVRQVGDQLVAYDQVQQRLHVLSRTAAATWRYCDGRNSLADIAELVGRELGIPADERLIELALEQLDEARLLEERLAPVRGADGVSRRQMLHWAVAGAAGVFLPVITSCGAPLGPDRGPNVPGVPQLNLGVVTTTSSTTPFPATTTSTTSTTPFPATTTSTTSTTPFPATTTSTTSTTPFPATTTSTTSTTPFPATTTSTTPPPTTTSTTPAPRKVLLCHKGKSIMVDANAVADHLAHGDTLGPCP